ncbi:MAG: hypothetical protein PHR35_11725 [Kiritimatiellae bacterium]|nr:hypothetical protein [Kiritimatiellia bacterium]
MIARRAHLVCQHLENISRGALEKHQDLIRDYVKRRQGVYALYRRDRLYYVGLATNLRSRLKQHLRDRHGSSWDRFSVYLTIGCDHLQELEALILRTMKPRGNKKKGKLPKSEDLRRRFKRDMKARAMAEIDGCMGVVRTVRRRRKEAVETGAETDGRSAVLAAYIAGALKLRARFKGKTVRCRVRRDGTLLFGGEAYTSPSLAAAAACGRKTCNGWTFWQYERAPDDWVTLDTLRR